MLGLLEHTFTISTQTLSWVLSIVGFLVGFVATITIIIKTKRLCKRKQMERWQRDDEARHRAYEQECKWEEQSKKKERTKLEEMFPQPWLVAYDECESAGDTSMRMFWFDVFRREMMKELPQLSLDAIEKFAKMTTGSSCNEDFRNVLEKLNCFFRFPDLQGAKPKWDVTVESEKWRRREL